MRSVRLPIPVPSRMNGEARSRYSFCCRGRRVAVTTSMPMGFPAIKSNAAGRQPPSWAGYVNRGGLPNYKVPRSRAPFAGQLRGGAWPILSAGLSVEFSGACRCVGGVSVSSPSPDRGFLLCGRVGRMLSAMQLWQLRTALGVGSLTTASGAREPGHRYRSCMSAPGAHAER